MIMAITAGITAALTNPLDEVMMGNIITADALRGNDLFCENYLNEYRAGKFEFVKSRGN